MQTFSVASLPSLFAYDFQPLKPRTRTQDLHDLLEFIWMCDTEAIEHPRYRLQVVLVILLSYYLGLHPGGALSDGLYYRDTQLLLFKHDNTIRVILILQLEGRKKFRTGTKHWQGYVTIHYTYTRFIPY
jgi:hypothetical protein